MEDGGFKRMEDSRMEDTTTSFESEEWRLVTTRLELKTVVIACWSVCTGTRSVAYGRWFHTERRGGVWGKHFHFHLLVA